MKQHFKAARYAPENIERIALIHIKRYEGHIASAAADERVAKRVNVFECHALKALWNNIIAAGCVWDDLSEWQQREIHDALFDEDPEDTENDA